MLKDLIQKIIIVLSLEYLIFFSAEVILPGVITSAFNINILLLGVIFLVALLIVWPNTKNNKNNKINSQQKLRACSKQFLFLVGALLSVSIIALYKVSIIMMFVYAMVVIISVKLLWNNKSTSR